MYLDLFTLYLLVIGTLLASAAMTYWEHLTHPTRSRPLRSLAAGFGMLALGCTAAIFRHAVPGGVGSGLANLVILGGYLLVLDGAAALSGRQYRRFSVALLGLTAATWLVAGPRGQEVMWNYVSAFPIGVISGMTAWVMLRGEAWQALQARRIVVVVTCLHTVLYASRALVLPWLVAEYGAPMQALASKITIYVGVLYSVLLPMALLKLIREEAHGQLLKESQTDYLTRLGNRRWFFEEGERLVAQGAGRQALAVLAFDLDQFKAINDRHGHQTGDQVLKSFAEIARGVMGGEVLLARIGGEEFAALLTGEDARRAQALGEEIARRFPVDSVAQAGIAGLSPTVSIGLATDFEQVPTLAQALAAADQALYRAKSQGGNRLEIA